MLRLRLEAVQTRLVRPRVMLQLALAVPLLELATLLVTRVLRQALLVLLFVTLLLLLLIVPVSWVVMVRR